MKYCQLELPLQRKNCEGRTIKQTSEEYVDCNGRKRTIYITEVGAKPKRLNYRIKRKHIKKGEL